MDSFCTELVFPINTDIWKICVELMNHQINEIFQYRCQIVLWSPKSTPCTDRKWSWGSHSMVFETTRGLAPVILSVVAVALLVLRDVNSTIIFFLIICTQKCFKSRQNFSLKMWHFRCAFLSLAYCSLSQNWACLAHFLKYYQHVYDKNDCLSIL